MSTEPDISIENRGDVRIVWWRDEENRFNANTLGALHGVLDDAEAHDGPLSLVLANDGKIFSNGLDLNWLGSGDGDGDAFFRGLYRLFGRILTFPGVTAAAVCGHAFGAGAILSMCCDYRVMRSDRGYWCMPEADMSIPLTDGLLAPLQARVPADVLVRILGTAGRYGGPEAVELGLMNAAVEEAEVLPTAISLVEPLAGKDRQVAQQHKRMVFAPWLDQLGSE